MKSEKFCNLKVSTEFSLTISTLKHTVVAALIGDKCQTESSGNINEKTIREYAHCGVNYISSGALTHSALQIRI